MQDAANSILRFSKDRFRSDPQEAEADVLKKEGNVVVWSKRHSRRDFGFITRHCVVSGPKCMAKQGVSHR
jgi:hypothetical protein